MVSAGPHALWSLRGKSPPRLLHLLLAPHSLVFRTQVISLWISASVFTWPSSLCVFTKLTLHVNLSGSLVPRLNIICGCLTMRVFPDEKSTQVADFSKWVALLSVGRFPPVCWEPEWNRRQRKELVSTTASLIYLEISFHPLPWGWGLSLSPLVLRLLDLDWIVSSAFLGLQFANADIGLLHLHNLVSQVLIINKLINFPLTPLASLIFSLLEHISGKMDLISDGKNRP